MVETDIADSPRRGRHEHPRWPSRIAGNRWTRRSRKRANATTAARPPPRPTGAVTASQNNIRILTKGRRVKRLRVDPDSGRDERRPSSDKPGVDAMRILIVEDEPTLLAQLATSSKARGYLSMPQPMARPACTWGANIRWIWRSSTSVCPHVRDRTDPPAARTATTLPDTDTDRARCMAGTRSRAWRAAPTTTSPSPSTMKS